MIMIQASSGANISQYGSYISNCTKNQMPYRVPVINLQAVQLYVDIGAVQPDTIEVRLIHTCGRSPCYRYTVANDAFLPRGYVYTDCEGNNIIALASPNSEIVVCAREGSVSSGSGDITITKGAGCGDTETIIPGSYVIGQDTNDNWYGVFKNFSGAVPTCFVIAITLTFGDTEVIYFSEEYCIENVCESLTLLKGCYGNLDNKISYDAEGIYFGTALGDGAMGDLTLVYKHEIYLRNVEVSLSAIRNVFKQGRTRNFRTEKEKVYQFYGEFVPEWFLSEIDAVFFRGEVFVAGVKYLVNETAFEKIEDCKRMWKPSATFKKSNYQSFSCEDDPCAAPTEDSGSGESGSSGVESGEESGNPPIPEEGDGQAIVGDCGNGNAISEIRFNDEYADAVYLVSEGETKSVSVPNAAIGGTLEIDVTGHTGGAETRFIVTDSNGFIQCQPIAMDGTYTFLFFDVVPGEPFTIEITCGGICD